MISKTSSSFKIQVESDLAFVSPEYHAVGGGFYVKNINITNTKLGTEFCKGPVKMSGPKD